MPALHKYAYPQPGDSGMTLRDYFAAAAMQAMLCSDRDFLDAAGSPVHEPDEFAKLAYEQADAMMEARTA